MSHRDEIRRTFTRQVDTGTSTPIDAESLERLLELADPRPSWRVLDIGCGPGGVALALAPLVREIVAVDVTPTSLAAALERARREGIQNVRFEEADAEQLPYEDHTFELIVCRRVGHHLRALDRALAEMARVMTRGGRLIIDDRVVPEDAEIDRPVNDLERARDASHVRCLPVSEWRERLAVAGFEVETVESYERWVSWERFLAPVPPQVRRHLLEQLEDLAADPSLGPDLVDADQRRLRQWSALFRARRR